MPGLVPGIPLRDARPCQTKRDGRDKPGHDKKALSSKRKGSAPLVRAERRSQAAVEVLRAVAVLVRQEIVGDLAQARGEPVCGGLSVLEMRFADDGAHGVHMLVDELAGNAVELGRMLDQPAQAVGHVAGEGEAKSLRLALDVMG